MELRDFIGAAAGNDELLEALHNQPLSEAQQAAITRAGTLRDKIVAILQTVQDPEMPINIWDLGLVYRLDVSAEGDAVIDMTLTAPGCPVAGAMPVEVEKRITRLAPEVRSVSVNLVWAPRWHKDMMSDDAKLLLDMW